MSYRLVDANELVAKVDFETQNIINNMPCVFADIKPENQHINIEEIRADERARVIEEMTEQYFDVIESVLHNRDIALELNQALTIYARIMSECNKLAEQLKEQNNG
jgi:hypothetical protein